MTLKEALTTTDFKTNVELVGLVYRQLRKLLELEEHLTMLLVSRGNLDMSPEVTEILTAMDAATSRIASRVDRLVKAAPSLSADEKAAFAVEIDALNKLGSDPVTPVPPGV